MRVAGQMANVRAQVGLVEKSESGMCVCWNPDMFVGVM